MRFSDEFRDRALVEQIASRIACHAGVTASIMEVCGTHTMSAAKYGLRALLPSGVRLVSGPGCPVCVTDQREIDSFLAIGQVPGVILTSFGDMLRVPGSKTSLEKLRANGVDVRVLYSPMDAVDIARDNTGSEVVFFGVGFETTMPATAVALKTAAENGLENFFLFCSHKTMPAALRALLSMGEVRLTGLLLPGHVTTIIGTSAYDFIPREFGIPCAVTGFEPVDIMLGIESVLKQSSEGVALVDNVYSRAVKSDPNEKAQGLLSDVFETADANWRGIGLIPGSGVAISQKYSALDAKERFADVIAVVPEVESSPCRCGEVLRGVIDPVDCSLFGKTCTPSE
ncbi:MAG: hydrogenase formation protein HypD, partial [Armatimonadetes bacterium]|nr:hydrogenase formation protein HypD [Armatimonadota bacterium]